jgi:hypothetical protein
MSSLAAVVVGEVIDELQSRSGFDAWAEEIDDQVWEELVDRLVERVDTFTASTIAVGPKAAAAFLRVIDILHDSLGPGDGDFWDWIEENDKLAYDAYYDVLAQMREVSA